MKKTLRLLSTVISLVLIAVMGSVSVSAADDTDAALAFDSEAGVQFWKTDNNDLTKQTGLKLSLTSTEVYAGTGALAVSEDLTSDADSTLTGGAYITASDFGLTDFSGCNITFEVYPVTNASVMGAKYIFYTDGMLYLPASQTDLTPERWNKITLSVPENCENTRIGFLTPIYTIYSGDVFYLDDLVITKPDGSFVENVGDYKALPDETPVMGTGMTILLIIILVIVAVGVVAAIGFGIYRLVRRYH